MPFDPSKPYDAVEEPGFDPAKPFQEVPEDQNAKDAADYRAYQIGQRDRLSRRREGFERNVLNPLGWAEYLTGQTHETFSRPITTIVKGVGAAEEMAGILPEGWSNELSEDLVKSPLARVADIPAPESNVRGAGQMRFLAGIGNSVKRVAEFLTSADGAPLLASGFAGAGAAQSPQAAKVLSGTFAADMALHAPEQFNAAVEAIEQGDTKKAGEAIGGFLIATGGSAGAATHALAKPGPRITTTLSRHVTPLGIPKVDLSRWKRTDEPMLENPLPNVGEQPKPNENQIQTPGKVSPQPSVPVEQPPAEQAQVRTPQRGSEGEQGATAPGQAVEQTHETGAKFTTQLRKNGTTRTTWTQTRYGKRVGDAYSEGDPAEVIAAKNESTQPPDYRVKIVSEILGPNTIEIFVRDMTAEEIDATKSRLQKENDFRRDLGIAEEPIPEPNKPAESKAQITPGQVVPAEKGVDTREAKEKDAQAKGSTGGGLTPVTETPATMTPEPSHETKAAQAKVPEPLEAPANPSPPEPVISNPPVTETTTPEKAKKSYFLRRRSDGQPDLLHDIQELGGIRSPRPDEKGGEWDGFKEAMVGPAKLLISRKAKHTPDTIIAELGSLGWNIKTADHLYEMITKQVAEREALRTGVNPEVQTEKFWHAMSPSNTKGMVKVNADQLKIGDKFKLKGRQISDEVLEVTWIDADTGEIQVSDGRTLGIQNIPEGTEFWALKKGLKIKKESAEFLPPEDMPVKAPKAAKAPNETITPQPLITPEPIKQSDIPKAAAPTAPVKEPTTIPLPKFAKGLTVVAKGGFWEVVDVETGKTLLKRTNEQDARNRAQGIMDALDGGKMQFSAEEVVVPEGFPDTVEGARKAVQNAQALEDSAKHWSRNVTAPVDVTVVYDPANKFRNGVPFQGAFYQGEDGRLNVILNSANIPSEAEGFRTYVHEMVGHFGVQQVLAGDYNRQLDKWAVEILSDPIEGAKLLKKANQRGYEFADKDGFKSEDAKRHAVEEYIATHHAERTGVMTRIMDWIKDAWAKLWGKQTTETEIRDLLRKARKYVRTETEAKYFQGERLSLAKTEEEAIDTKARTLARNKLLEGESFTGQAEDISRVLKKHAGGISEAARDLLGVNDYEGIASTGASMSGARADYRALKEKYGADSYDLISITRPAATQMLRFSDRLAKVAADHVTESQRLSKPGIRSLLKNTREAAFQAVNAEAVLEQSKAIFNSAHRLAEKALEKEAKDDNRASVLQGRLQQVDEMSRSSSAIQQVVADMVNVLSSVDGGVELLSRPTVQARSLTSLYTDLKRSTGQRLHNQTLIDWASYILSKDAKLRDQFLSASFSADEGVKRLLDPYQAKFLADYGVDPVKTVDKALSMRGKLTSKMERAAFAWQTLNRRLLDEFKGFRELGQAADVARNILDDPDFVALRTEILNDAKIKGRVAPFSYRAGEAMVLPDGTTVDLTGKFDMTGSRSEGEAKYREMERAREVLRDYIAEGNLDDPDFNVHVENLKMLDALYMTDSVMRPKDAIRLVRTALGTLNGVIARIGGRPAAIVTALVRNFEETNKRAAHWRDVWSTEISLGRARAIDSHGFRKHQSLADANRQWNEEIGWELADSLQSPQGGLKVGEKTMWGHVITAQDIADVRTSSNGATAAFGIVQAHEKRNGTANRNSAGAGLAAFRPQLTKDTLGGVVYYRDALKGSEHMVPRGINDDRAGFAEKFAEAYGRGDNDTMVRLFNDNPGFMRSFLRDRTYHGATATIFDGQGGAFDVLSKRIADGRYKGVTMDADWLARELSSLSDVSPEEARKIVLDEAGAAVARFWRQEKPEVGPSAGRAEDTKNTFTRSRNDKIAPYWFYETGFKDQDSILGFAANISSHALDDVVNGMRVAIVDIERQEQDLFARTSQVGSKAAVTENARAKKNGQTYDDWKNLQWRKNQLVGMISDLTVDRYDAQANQLLRRTIGVGIQSKLTSTPTTLKNVTTGPAYLGGRLNKLMDSAWLGYIPAFYQTWIPGLFKTLWSVGKHEVIAKAIRVPQGLFKATGQALREGFAFRSFLHTLGRDNLVEITDRLYDDMTVYKKMQEAGIVFTPDFVKDYDSRLMVSMRDAGLIPGQTESKGTEGYKTVLGAIELGFGADAKAKHPFIGDFALNSAAYQAMMSSAGPFHTMQKQLARLYYDWETSGGKLREFDWSNVNSPVNRLSHQEVFPSIFKGGKRLFTSETGYNAAVKMYQTAGVDFQAAAMRYLTDLRTKKKDAMFLSEAERNAMTSSTIDAINRSTVANSPQALRKAHFINQVIAPFLNWPVRTAGQLLDSLQIASRDPDTRRAQAIGLVTLGVVLPYVVASIATDIGTEEADRKVKRLLYNQIKATRQPWEREGTKSQVIGWALSAANTVPFLDKVMNMALNDLPTRGRQDFSLVAIETMKDISRYVGGVIQTGDPTYKLPDLLGSLVPESRAILNRLPGLEGSRQANNVVALMRRSGPTELLRPTGDSQGFGVNVTGLSPYADRMVNAAMKGDIPEFSNLYAQAVQVATDLGRPNPEKLVTQLFTSRSPYNRAFKSKLTEEQRQEFLGKLSTEDRAVIQDSEAKFQAAAQTLGKTVTFAKAEATGPSFASAGPRSQTVSRVSAQGIVGSRQGSSVPSASVRGSSLRRGASLSTRTRRGRRTLRVRRPSVRSARVRVPSLRRGGRQRPQRV